MLTTLVPDYRARCLESLEELELGIAWSPLADPLVRARVEEAGQHFPRARQLDLSLPERVGSVFMREVAEVHRDLFREHAARYGENVRVKIEPLAVAAPSRAKRERVRWSAVERRHGPRAPVVEEGLRSWVDVVDPVHLLRVGLDIGEVEIHDHRLLTGAPGRMRAAPTARR